MPFDLAAAVVAGLAAGAVMAVPVVVARIGGAPLALDMPAVWASLVRVPSVGAVGVAVHAVVSVAVGLLYAAVADLVDAADHLLAWGLLGGVVHWAVAGIVLGGVATAAGTDAPGWFCARFGAADVVVFVVAHLAYGAAFGVVYGLASPDGGPGLVW